MATLVSIGHDCGYTGKFTSQAKAEAGFRRHSCARWQAKAAAAQRGELRRAAIDRTPKPCRHPRAKHQHGTYACYTLDSCLCAPCAAAAKQYEQNRLRQHAYGRWNGLVDAGPARQHVQALRRQGVGLKRVSALSGVSHGALSKLIYGSRPGGKPRSPSERITPSVESRLLAVRFSPALLAGGCTIDATGTRRRIQALIAIGWSMAKIGQELGIGPTNLGKLLAQPTVTASTARKVVDLYERWWNQPPEGGHRSKIAAARARNYARIRGFHVPLAWDDDTIDDPAAVPASPEQDDQLDEVAVQRAMDGTLRLPLPAGEKKSPPELVEAIRRLAAKSWSDKQIGQRTGLATSAVFKQRQRHNIRSAWAQRPQPASEEPTACTG